jgi:hypothetical protein
MQPAFVLSLDTELVWGSFDHTSPAAFEKRYPDVRGTIARILAVLEEYEVAATWAVVGHLFLRECTRGQDGRAHPEMLRPHHAWFGDDWLSADPCTDRARDPLFYGDDVVDRLIGASTKQDIGSHSFSHAVFGEEGCTRDVAESELRACIALAETKGVKLSSFVFPRNSEGHHDVLRAHGITAYRGEDPTWYRKLPGPTKQAAHFIDQASALAPPVVQPSETLPGLWNIPGSMLLIHRTGARKLITLDARLEKAKAGMRRAIDEGGIFHLWSHPFNLAPDRDGMIHTFRAIIAEAVALRDRGRLRILTMQQVAAEAAQQARA